MSRNGKKNWERLESMQRNGTVWKFQSYKAQQGPQRWITFLLPAIKAQRICCYRGSGLCSWDQQDISPSLVHQEWDNTGSKMLIKLWTSDFDNFLVQCSMYLTRFSFFLFPWQAAAGGRSAEAENAVKSKPYYLVWKGAKLHIVPWLIAPWAQYIFICVFRKPLVKNCWGSRSSALCIVSLKLRTGKKLSSPLYQEPLFKLTPSIYIPSFVRQ